MRQTFKQWWEIHQQLKLDKWVKDILQKGRQKNSSTNNDMIGCK